MLLFYNSKTNVKAVVCVVNYTYCKEGGMIFIIHLGCSVYYGLLQPGAQSMHIKIAFFATYIINEDRGYYCNFLFYNIALHDILKLQRVQNCLARVVTQSPLSSNQHIYNHCSRLQDSPDSFEHLVITHCPFPVFRQTSKLEVSQLPKSLPRYTGLGP